MSTETTYTLGGWQPRTKGAPLRLITIFPMGTTGCVGENETPQQAAERISADWEEKSRKEVSV